MAKVKIQGHASGTGILTVTAPNTSTDRTITLPDATGTLATTAIAQLDYSGTKKLETTADGVTISGGSSTGANLTVTSTATDDNIAPDLILYRNSASPADNDNLGGLEWQGNHSGGSVNSYAQITCLAEDVTDGTEDGALRFYTAINGATTEKLRITGDGRGLSQFTAKAWINFNGTGTVAIRDSHNISSIVDGGTGYYTVNIDVDMANANYALSVASGRNDTSSGYHEICWIAHGTYPAASNFVLSTGTSHHAGVTGGTQQDHHTVCAVVFGD